MLRVGEDWIAIDCCLPGSGTPSVRDRYRRFVERLGIARLRAFIITHYDLDHYRGAAWLLRWFEEERGGVRALYATLSLDIRAYAARTLVPLRRPEQQREFLDWRDEILARCRPAGAIRLIPIVADAPPLALGKVGGGWHLAALYPFYTTQIRAVMLVTGAGRQINHNYLSAALMVCREGADAPLLLLGGDVPGDPAWAEAMASWRDRARDDPDREWLPTSVGARWIKAPHHGSATAGHSDALFSGSPPSGERHAFISAAPGPRKLPDRSTLAAYLSNGFRVWNTGELDPRRINGSWALTAFEAAAPVTASRPAGVAPDDDYGVSISDVAISVYESDNSPRPAHAEVTAAMLSRYRG